MPGSEIKKYIVRLSEEQREILQSLTHESGHPAARILRAHVLLKADVAATGKGWSDGRIVRALNTSPSTVFRIRQRLVEEGFDDALTRRHSPNSARRRIFDAAAEARLVALARSPPPDGRARWTLTLLEDKVVELNIVEHASDNTIWRTLKKVASNQA
jgi:Homeodomain-like domain